MKFKLLEDYTFTIRQGRGFDTRDEDITVPTDVIKGYIKEFYTDNEIMRLYQEENPEDVDATFEDALEFIEDNIDYFDDLYDFIQDCVQEEYQDRSIPADAYYSHLDDLRKAEEEDEI